MYDDNIRISTINDFIFCPRSLYFHGVYESFDKKNYHTVAQTNGTLKHTASDIGTYSSRRRYIQGMEVSSDRWGVVGKIDIYDRETGALIERKAKISRVYDGYKWQLLAQAVCLEEMGYEVKETILHSLSNNKKYHIEFSANDWKQFLKTMREMRAFDIASCPVLENKEKCRGCIYNTLCRNDL